MNPEKMEGDGEKSTASGSGEQRASGGSPGDEEQQRAGPDPKEGETSGSRPREPPEVPTGGQAAAKVEAEPATFTPSLSPLGKLQPSLKLFVKELNAHIYDVIRISNEFLSITEVSNRHSTPRVSSQESPQENSASPGANEASSPAGSSGERKGFFERLLQAAKIFNADPSSCESSQTSLEFDKLLSHTNDMGLLLDFMSYGKSDEDVSGEGSMKQEGEQTEALLDRQLKETLEIFKIFIEKAQEALQDVNERLNKP
ncbi:uncharacterized protein [Penaeus vannamei]|uniref:Uncharacterized protein n=1 Tax=Penaeus vannamei TaxID=6689 RepID=A0A3R7PKS7_PENVA|nr:uncharacterized protein LOC113807413 [Penaeus vannamei]ROT75070.1 hypothetical protein C7M84_006356 [Penaeus vannamei]